MIIPALLNVLVGKILTRAGILVVALFAYLWCVRSVAVFFSLTLRENRRKMALYPALLYYLFFAAFVVLV